MLEDVIIIGIVMCVTEIIKRILKRTFEEDTVTQIVPLIVLGFAGLLNVVNAAVFNGMPLITALGEGIKLGAIAGGVYGLGKAALGKS